jgi:hypothetical protein
MTGLSYKRHRKIRATTTEVATAPAAAPDTAPSFPEVAPIGPANYAEISASNLGRIRSAIS